jgi:hypothetical protein
MTMPSCTASRNAFAPPTFLSIAPPLNISNTQTADVQDRPSSHSPHLVLREWRYATTQFINFHHGIRDIIWVVNGISFLVAQRQFRDRYDGSGGNGDPACSEEGHSEWEALLVVRRELVYLGGHRDSNFSFL